VTAGKDYNPAAGKPAVSGLFRVLGVHASTGAWEQATEAAMKRELMWGTQMWRALVDHSKYVAWPSFGEAPRGHILLQDHGNRVSFRSIKIRESKASS
jgi:hypothetical protein